MLGWLHSVVGDRLAGQGRESSSIERPADRGRTGNRAFAAVYDVFTMPAERGWLGRCRRELLAQVGSSVLEVGAGTGANLRHYPRSAGVVAIEPDAAMRSKLAYRSRSGKGRACAVLGADAEALPFPSGVFDTVVCTLVLCSVRHPDRVLGELHRVLSPNGRLLVIEHVRDSGRRAEWQRRLTPFWRRLAGGCRLDHDARAAIERADFAFERSVTFVPPMSLPWLRPFLVGTAVPLRRTGDSRKRVR